MSRSPVTPDDPRLTAYVLDELAADERSRLEQAIASSPEVRAAVDEIRSTSSVLFAALQLELQSGSLVGDEAQGENRGGEPARVVVATGEQPRRRRGSFVLANVVTILMLAGLVIGLNTAPEGDVGTLDELVPMDEEFEAASPIESGATEQAWPGERFLLTESSPGGPGDLMVEWKEAHPARQGGDGSEALILGGGEARQQQSQQGDSTQSREPGQQARERLNEFGRRSGVISSRRLLERGESVNGVIDSTSLSSESRFTDTVGQRMNRATLTGGGVRVPAGEPRPSRGGRFDLGAVQSGGLPGVPSSEELYSNSRGREVEKLPGKPSLPQLLLEEAGPAVTEGEVLGGVLSFQLRNTFDVEEFSDRFRSDRVRDFDGDSSAPVVADLGLLGMGQAANESYAAVTENEFIEPIGEAALSTFGLDVDTASYSNVRRFLEQGQLPPADAVRIEELVNYFDYDLPPPEGEEPLSVTLEAASCPWSPRHRLVRIGVQGKQIDFSKRPPTTLVFLLDVSGSMRDENKLPLVKESMRLLVSQLNENDRIAIVTYAGEATLRLDSTSGDDRETILSAIERLSAGGSTNGAGGIELAYEVASRHFIREGANRVILCTDGDFNVGASSDEALVQLIEEKRKSGVFLSVFGFGMGNLKDSKLEGLANKGNGQYGYIDGIEEARKAFIEDLSGTLYTIAKDVKLQVEFNPAKVGTYRLLGYENRVLEAADFNNDAVDSGELGSGHTVTALYEIIPAGEWQRTRPKRANDVDPLKYQSGGRPGSAGASTEKKEAATVDRRRDETGEERRRREEIEGLLKAVTGALQTTSRFRVSVEGDVFVLTPEGEIEGFDPDELLKLLREIYKEQSVSFVMRESSATGEGSPASPVADELLTVKVRYKQPDGETSVKREFPLRDEPTKVSSDLQWAAAVTGFGLLLRNSQYAGDVNWDLVLELAQGAASDPDERQREFLSLSRKAAELWQASGRHPRQGIRLTDRSVEGVIDELAGPYVAAALESGSWPRPSQTLEIYRRAPETGTAMYIGRAVVQSVGTERVLAAVTALAGGAEVQAGDRVTADLQTVAESWQEGQSPRGRIRRILGREVVEIDLGWEDRLTRGDRLTVRRSSSRAGATFEYPVGYVRVVSVEAKRAFGTWSAMSVDGGRTPLVDDIVAPAMATTAGTMTRQRFGEVKAVAEDGEATLSLVSEERLVPGETVELFREGASSGEVSLVGRAVVVRVTEGEATARVIESDVTAPVQSGDRFVVRY